MEPFYSIFVVIWVLPYPQGRLKKTVGGPQRRRNMSLIQSGYKYPTRSSCKHRRHRDPLQQRGEDARCENFAGIPVGGECRAHFRTIGTLEQQITGTIAHGWADLALRNAIGSALTDKIAAQIIK